MSSGKEAQTKAWKKKARHQLFFTTVLTHEIMQDGRCAIPPMNKTTPSLSWCWGEEKKGKGGRKEKRVLIKEEDKETLSFVCLSMISLPILCPCLEVLETCANLIRLMCGPQIGGECSRIFRTLHLPNASRALVPQYKKKREEVH